MGLDTYAARSPDGDLTDADVAAFEATGIDLCGGIFSDGVTSIRGKIYNDLVLEVTGFGLYEYWIPPETVREMARALYAVPLEELVESAAAAGGRYTLGASEVESLKVFFGVCAERGLGLIGSW